MRIRHSTAGLNEKVQIEMTPMIDVVFQLLAFFIMTLKLVQVEGDFNVTMPAPGQAGPEAELLPIQVRLEAAPDGSLAAIRMGDVPLGSMRELREAIIGIVGTDAGPGTMAAENEVEFDADYNLRYEHIMEAITAVSGYVRSDNTSGKLVEKISFAPARPPE